IVAGLKMRAQQQNEARISVIRRRPVDAGPECVTGARAGGTNVGMTVVAVDAPGVKYALMIEQLMAWPANVIHDLVATILLQRLAHTAGDFIEHFVPTHP